MKKVTLLVALRGALRPEYLARTPGASGARSDDSPTGSWIDTEGKR